MSGVNVHQPHQDGILLSEAAKAHLVRYLDKVAAKGVRFSVKKAGCSGLAYVMDYVSTPEPNDVILALNETFFIYIDKSSYPYLQGLFVDYVKQGLNHRFVFENPNQKGQCGCGESFTV